MAAQAVSRYRRSLLFSGCVGGKVSRHNSRNPEEYTSSVMGRLQELAVVLAGPCETVPYMDMDESYSLTVSTNSQTALRSKSVWGIMRGLETFSQLVYPYNQTHFAANETQVEDAPRFSHRGLLIDTSRHFLPVHAILDTLDAMAFNKMNVLHWHIVDDPSFPFVSKVFPDLSAKATLASALTPFPSPRFIYMFSSARFISCILHVPRGHTQSWGKGYPDLLTACYKGTSPNGKYGPMNPALESTFRFLEQFFEEVASVFPDQYLHLGGDEVSFGCWMSNPNITAFMERLGISGHYIKLEEYYIQRQVGIA
ncbi:unnamed protein product [Ixodes hexagonus]